MGIATLVVVIVLAAMATFSGVGKLRHDAHIVQVVHETVGVPMRYFPALAACEIAGAAGILLGLWWPLAGVAGGAGLVLYFAGAVVSHVRVHDSKGMGPAAFLLILSAAALSLRLLAQGAVL